MDEPESLTEAVASGDTRRSLVALRDYLAHELEGNRCKSCQISKLRTGDTAALALRLQKVIEDIAGLPAEVGEEMTELDKIRARRQQGGRTARFKAE